MLKMVHYIEIFWILNLFLDGTGKCECAAGQRTLVNSFSRVHICISHISMSLWYRCFQLIAHILHYHYSCLEDSLSKKWHSIPYTPLLFNLGHWPWDWILCVFHFALSFFNIFNANTLSIWEIKDLLYCIMVAAQIKDKSPFPPHQKTDED